jgi:hypothetical protein
MTISKAALASAPVTGPQGVFISYRREQATAHAGRLFDRLADSYGEDAVFMDIDSIGVGLDFARVLEDAVSSCSVMLVLIGPGWAGIAGDDGRRLEDPDDYVRQEIETGLRRDIRVVPVLVGGASLPSPEELPEGLRPLVRRQAFPLPDETFRSQARVLVERLRPVIGAGNPDPQPAREAAWSVEPVDKSFRHRVLRLGLSHAQHIVTFRVQWLSSVLLVDDVVVGRRYKVSSEEGKPDIEIDFELGDGDAKRRCTFHAYYGALNIARVALIVDGELLYDEAQSRPAS